MMQGQHIYQPKLFVQIDIEKLVPQNHLLRKIDQILDLSFVRNSKTVKLVQMSALLAEVESYSKASNSHGNKGANIFLKRPRPKFGNL